MVNKWVFLTDSHAVVGTFSWCSTGRLLESEKNIKDVLLIRCGNMKGTKAVHRIEVIKKHVLLTMVRHRLVDGVYMMRSAGAKSPEGRAYPA